MKNAVGACESVLVLGGRSEIGLAIARRLVDGGAERIVLAAREGESGEHQNAEAAATLRSAGARDVTVVPFDYAEVDAHPAVATEIFDTHGDLDVVVDAGGVLGDTAAYEADPAAAGHAAIANFAGHVSIGLAVAERLKRQGHGTYVVLSSTAGVRVRRSNYVYGAAKAGLDGFSRGLGDALVGSGVRVMTVRPGFVRTKLTAGRPSVPLTVDAEAVATAVTDGLRMGRETVWVPPVFGPMFGVFGLLPRSIWRRLPF